jgi:hypothetical protein
MHYKFQNPYASSNIISSGWSGHIAYMDIQDIQNFSQKSCREQTSWEAS